MSQIRGRQQGKPGPVPKAGGDRKQLLSKLPRLDAEAYIADAQRLGLPVSDWIAWKLAEATGRTAPDYVLRQLEQNDVQAEPTLFAQAS